MKRILCTLGLLVLMPATGYAAMESRDIFAVRFAKALYGVPSAKVDGPKSSPGYKFRVYSKIVTVDASPCKITVVDSAPGIGVSTSTYFLSNMGSRPGRNSSTAAPYTFSDHPKKSPVVCTTTTTEAGKVLANTCSSKYVIPTLSNSRAAAQDQLISAIDLCMNADYANFLNKDEGDAEGD